MIRPPGDFFLGVRGTHASYTGKIDKLLLKAGKVIVTFKKKVTYSSLMLK